LAPLPEIQTGRTWYRLEDFDMGELEKYYAGDEAWIDFSGTFEQFRNKPDVESLARKMGGHLDLACIIYGLVGRGYLNWINTKIPALDNITPFECLNSENLLSRLREMLMRMPC
jgi:hypothetical protein